MATARLEHNNVKSALGRALAIAAVRFRATATPPPIVWLSALIAIDCAVMVSEQIAESFEALTLSFRNTQRFRGGNLEVTRWVPMVEDLKEVRLLDDKRTRGDAEAKLLLQFGQETEMTSARRYALLRLSSEGSSRAAMSQAGLWPQSLADDAILGHLGPR